MSSSITFENSLEKTDYGLIICGKTGMLKGVFIPEGADDDDIPESVAEICREYFNIDPNDDTLTLH